MNARHFAVAVAVLGSACGVPQDLNYNTGRLGNLSIASWGPQAARVPLVVGVTRANSGRHVCSSYPGFGSLPGGTRCEFTGRVVTVTSIDSVECPNGGCTARVIDPSSVEVTGTATGRPLLRVTATLDDGSVVTDEHELELVEIDSVRIDCARGCTGPHAVLVGSRVDISFAAFGADAGVPQKVEVSEGDGLVEIGPRVYGRYEYDYGSALDGWVPVSITAKKAGVATLRLKLGPFETTRTLRIAAPDEAVAGELWTPAKSPWVADASGLGHDRLGTRVDADYTVRIYKNTFGSTEELVLAWKLRDGAYALGGAPSITADPAAALRRPSEGEVPDPITLRVDGKKAGAGANMVLRGQLGAATLEQSLRVGQEE